MSRLLSLLVILPLLATPAFAQQADLAVTKLLIPDQPVVVGESAVFEITVTNLGPDAASGVEITDPLAEGLVFDSYTATAGYFADGWGDWYVGDLAVDQSETLTLTTTFTATTPVVNCAFVKDLDQSDPDNSNDSDCVTVYPKLDTFVDIAVKKSVDYDTAPAGGTVTFTIEALNHGPATATGVFVADILPAGLSYASSTASQGAYDPASGDWTVGTLPAGARATLAIATTVHAADHPIENCAVVKDVDQEDTDPYNDYSCVCVNCEPSDGEDGGIESTGNLASALANRLFQRRVDAASRADAGFTPAPRRLAEDAVIAESAAARAATVLYNLVPDAGPNGSLGYVATPGDLIGITNATAVVAANYNRADGYRLAAMFGAASPAGELYDHAKATCDRLAGAELVDIRLASVDGHPFVVQKLVHADGSIDHSISFVAYRDGASYTIDSRFAPGAYTVPASGDEVLNFQVWSASEAYVREMAGHVLARIATIGTLSFVNTAAAPPALPGTFVRSGSYDGGAFTLALSNPAGASGVTFHGVTSAVEDGEQMPFEFAQPLSGSALEVITLPTGYTFDASITLSASGADLDQVYFADAPWSYGVDPAGAVVTGFTTFPQTAPFAPEVVGLERSAHISGTVATWASLFRFLAPRGLPRDLSHTHFVEFEAEGSGTFRLALEKASIESWDQYGVTFDAGSATTHRFYFTDFALASGAAGFTAEDVVMAAFYAVGDGSPDAFELRVSDLRFGNAPVAGEDDAAPLALALDAPFPNPLAMRAALAFTLPASGEVRLEVFDLLGRRAAVLVDGRLEAGRHTAQLDAAPLAAGTYVVRLQAGGETVATRATIIR